MKWGIPKNKKGFMTIPKDRNRRAILEDPSFGDFNAPLLEPGELIRRYISKRITGHRMTRQKSGRDLAWVCPPVASSPTTITLSNEILPGWRLSQPLDINIELDTDGSYVASDDVFGVHGDGKSPSLAVDDYKLSLIEYYELLSQRCAESTPTASLFQRLQAYLERIVN
jgi:predicted RNase H-like HicB family nuclease